MCMAQYHTILNVLHQEYGQLVYHAQVIIDSINAVDLFQIGSFVQAFHTFLHVSDSEARCPPMPLTNNADVVYYDYNNGGDSILECYPGHRFPDGKEFREIRCNNGQWNETDTPECSGVGQYFRMQLMCSMAPQHP